MHSSKLCLTQQARTSYSATSTGMALLVKCICTFQQTRTAGLHWYWRCGRQTWAIATILWHLASTHRRGSCWWPCSKGSSLHGNLPGVQKSLQRPSGLTSSTCGFVGRCVLARNRALSVIEWGEEEKARLNLVVIVDVTLLGTNISPPKVCLKMIFLSRGGIC